MSWPTYINQKDFSRFLQEQTRQFSIDTARFADATLATRDQWLAVAPKFEDFHALLPMIVKLQMQHIVDVRAFEVRELLRKLHADIDLARQISIVTISCSLHVHDSIVRSNRPPTSSEITAWSFEYGQQLSLAYLHHMAHMPHQSKHRGSKGRHIPPRKQKKRK